MQFERIELNIDSFENIIVNTLLFGSQIDLEDAIAVLSKNKEKIDFDLLREKAIKLDILNDLEIFLEEFSKLEKWVIEI